MIEQSSLIDQHVLSNNKLIITNNSAATRLIIQPIDLKQMMKAERAVGANSLVMINANTQIYGLIGNPIGHSPSPVLHNEALRRIGSNAIYMVMEVNDLPDVIGRARELNISGISVELPFRTQVLPLLDGLTRQLPGSGP